MSSPNPPLFFYLCHAKTEYVRTQDYTNYQYQVALYVYILKSECYILIKSTSMVNRDLRPLL